MRRIAIVGSGQSGLQLALGLQQHDYAVTLVSARSPEEIEAGPVTSSQCMFGTSLALEQALALNRWDDVCPAIAGMRVQVGGAEGSLDLGWTAPLDLPAQSVDQRLKHAAWLRLFGERGGAIQIRDASVADLEELARTHDLVVVASGRVQHAGLFALDPERSPFTMPQRALALTYVHGMEQDTSYPVVSMSFIPGVGELFIIPALTLSGPCEIMVFEGVPGGPMDCWDEVRGPAEHLALSLEILNRYIPWEAARCSGVEVTDASGVLTGRFAPTVRHPVATLPSGTVILALGDTVVLNDPLTGQGANNACKAADIYLRHILNHGNAPFDTPWMQTTFEAFWDVAQWVTGWTNTMLLPPPPHVRRLLAAAAEAPGVAAALVNGFDRPPTLFPWIVDPVEADRFIAAGGRTMPRVR